MDLTTLYGLSRQYLETKFQTYHRTALPETLFKHRLSVVLGQRGVGKTTLIVQHLLQCVGHDQLSPKILYVPADHFLLGGMSLYAIAEAFQSLGGEIIALQNMQLYVLNRRGALISRLVKRKLSK